MRIVYLVISVVALIGIITPFTQQGSMSGLQTFQESVSLIAYAGEFDKIPSLVEEFMVLKEMKTGEEKILYAENLDHRINNLELVKNFCNSPISSLEIVKQNEPYKKLQELCPPLMKVSFTKAVQLFKMI